MIIGNIPYRLLIGDCIATMKNLPDQSVNCCVTSPPYFGLRDYGVDGQIGLEETPEQYVAKMVEVFREVRRVMRDDGILWLNIGDSYYNYRPGNYSDNRAHAFGGERTDDKKRGMPDNPSQSKRGRRLDGLKEKDLIGIPWLLAFALRADGWYLRQDIIWNKPNPMPESVRDRCTKSHEYVFMMTKSEKYHFDHEVMIEPSADGKTRKKRSVWNVATKAYKGAHFATFPPELIEPCILAGCPVGGVVLDPFGGSGTTAGVAVAHNRCAILCELNADYSPLVPERVASVVKGIRSKYQ